MIEIVSIQVGVVQTLGNAAADDPNEPLWTTAFFKQPIAGAVRVGPLGLEGDQQADQRHHGGPDKAVLAYSADHYPFWRAHLGIAEMPWGSFGENLSLAGLDEEGVAIGDVWQAGETILQVSQPRQPCWKMSRRWKVPNLAQQVIANGKSGWYLRVLTGGDIATRSELALLQRPHPAWTVARASKVMHHRQEDLSLAAELAALPELSASWKETLSNRVARRGTEKRAPFDNSNDSN